MYFFPPVLGESDLLFRNVPVRTHEADQPGGSRGRGSRRLFPRIPRHAGRVALSQGRRKIYIYLYIYIFPWTIFTHALTHTHTRDVYSFRSETGCVLTRVAAGNNVFLLRLHGASTTGAPSSAPRAGNRLIC